MINVTASSGTVSGLETAETTVSAVNANTLVITNNHTAQYKLLGLEVVYKAV
jgi:hypothetical protein